MKLTEKILFSKDECQSIISNQLEDATNWNMNDRKYDSKTIHYNENNKWIFNKLKDFFEIETDLKIIKTKQEIHFHKFIHGDWFGKHNDNKSERLYAVGVLLNDYFEGGDFIFHSRHRYQLYALFFVVVGNISIDSVPALGSFLLQDACFLYDLNERV